MIAINLKISLEYNTIDHTQSGVLDIIGFLNTAVFAGEIIKRSTGAGYIL